MEAITTKANSVATQHAYNIKRLIDRLPKEITLRIIELLVEFRPRIVAIRETRRLLSWSANETARHTIVTDIWNPEPQWKTYLRDKYFEGFFNQREPSLGIVEDEDDNYSFDFRRSKIPISWTQDTIYVEYIADAPILGEEMLDRLMDMACWIHKTRKLALPYQKLWPEDIVEILSVFPHVVQITFVMRDSAIQRITTEELDFIPLSGVQETKLESDVMEIPPYHMDRYPSSKMEAEVESLMNSSESGKGRKVTIKVLGLKVGDKVM